MLRGTGYRDVDSSVTAVLTRFELRSKWALVRFFYLFRRVKKQSRTIEGLIASLFIVENWHTCYTLSLWSDETAILKFNGGVSDHILAANVCFRDLRASEVGVNLWSAQLQLCAVSPHNFTWPGVQFEQLIRRGATNVSEQKAGAY
jgi:hypothetical protein